MFVDQHEIVDLLFLVTAAVAAIGCVWIWWGLRRRRREHSALGRTVVVVGMVILLVLLLRLVQDGGTGGGGAGRAGGTGDAVGGGGLPASAVRATAIWDGPAALLTVEIVTDGTARREVVSLREGDWQRRLRRALAEPLRRRGLVGGQALALGDVDGGTVPVLLHQAIDQAARQAGWITCRADGPIRGATP